METGHILHFYTHSSFSSTLRSDFSFISLAPLFIDLDLDLDSKPVPDPYLEDNTRIGNSRVYNSNSCLFTGPTRLSANA